MFLLKKNTALGGGASNGEHVSMSAAIPNAPVVWVNPAVQAAPAALTAPVSDGKYRVMVCGTYPIGQSNGYSRVVYYISKYLGRKEDIRLTIYGFQNYNQTKGSQRNDIPESVILHDAMATENPRRNGFGEKEIVTYLREHPQDLVMIFNDPVVTTSIVQNFKEGLTPAERAQFKLVSYMDQVYPYQRKDYISLLNEHFDGIVAFTPYWKDIARSLGIRPEIPIYYFPHGFDSDLYYPIPKQIARAYHSSIPQDAFVILNLNRNQPRKRWDHTMMVMAELIVKHQAYKTSAASPPTPIRLVVGTQVQGFFDMFDILEHELKLKLKPTPSPERVKALVDEYIVVLPNAQMLSDRDINILYNACDIGLNTCDGEGFGLCQFEHLALAKPQVAPGIGGFREFLHVNNSVVVEPKWRYYVDRIRDGIGGMAELGDIQDYVAGIWKYYQNPQVAKKHGRRGRDEILQHYRWESMVNVFYNILQTFAAGTKTPALT
jgi:glycosyltransferase involved in cell wall biosynthesis